MPVPPGTTNPDEDDQEFEPRARIVNAATGQVTPVRKSDLTGLDEFSNAWRQDVEIPEAMGFSGWQMSDDMHPAGTGTPAYRLVHKMIKTVPFPMVDMTFPNVQIRLRNGPVTLGEPRFKGTLPGRRAGTYMIPEWGTLKTSGDQWGYEYQQNMNVEIDAHQETTPPANYLEILYHLPAGDWELFDEMLAAGRAGVAALTCIIDLIHGERVLGPVLTEEIGETFDDWHWNRRLGGRTVSMESQAQMRHIDGQSFADTLGSAIERHVDKSDEVRNRIKIAAQWYWRADAEADRVQKYIAYWLCIEALELGENANIFPIKRAAADILGVDEKEVGAAVGKMYGIRSGLVHGSIREVSHRATEDVGRLAIALLERRVLGTVSEDRRDALRSAIQPGAA